MTTRKQEEEFRDEIPLASDQTTVQGQKSLPDLLNEIETRANAATKGPWRKCSAHKGECSCESIWSVPVDAPVCACNSRWGDGQEGTEIWIEYGDIGVQDKQASKTFIAAARSDVPALAQALRLALAQLESMKTHGFPEEHENQAVTGTLSAIAQLLRESAEEKK